MNHPIGLGRIVHSMPTFVKVVIVILPSEFVTTVSCPIGMVIVLVISPRVLHDLRLR
jgi:hypothetical protein